MSRSALPGFLSTWSAPSALPGGLPMPIRTRTKSSVCRCALIDSQAVVAGQAAADLHLHAPHGQVELVVDDHEAVRVGRCRGGG